ncbi:MAG: PAS domain S-box protein [Halarsenatibacteraceae bacterium]
MVEQKKIKPDVTEDILNSWQSIVDIMATMANVPAALIMKADAPYIEVFVSSKGQDNPYRAGDKEKMDGVYCEHVIRTGENLNIPNALNDDDWKNNPDIELGMISYYGLPVYWPDGDVFGTICILDNKEHEYNEDIIKLIDKFKNTIESHLKMVVQKNQIIKMQKELNKKVKDLVLTRNQLFTTLYSIGDGVIVTDLDGEITFMNSAAEEMTGWNFEKAESLEIDQVFNIVNAQTGETAVNPVDKVIEEGVIVGLANDTTLIAKDGSIRHIADTAAPIKDYKGKITGTILVFSDITAEYNYKRELESSRQLLQSVIDSLSDNIAVIDENGYITHVNESWKDFARENGLDPEKVGVGVNYFSSLANGNSIDENVKKFIDGIEAVIAGERKEARFEYPCHSPDIDRWFIARATPFKLDNEDKITGAVIVHENITARKKSELELINEQHWLSAIFENSNDAMVKVNSDHIILDINSEFTELFGFTLDDVQGINIDDVLDRQKSDVANREATERFLSGEKVELEEARYTKSGEKKICLIKGIPVKINRKMVGGYVQYIDITERKMREEKIEHISIHDSLTGLYNRYYLEQELVEHNRTKELPVSIILFDLNGLKLINDTYGHQAGDQIIIELSKVLKEKFKDLGIVGRWAGDEFLVITPGLNKQEAEGLAAKVSDKDLMVELANDNKLFVSIAYGASAKTRPAENIFDILHQAEDYMFREKLLKEKSTKSRLVKLLLSALHEKSQETESHAKRMTELANLLGDEIGLSDSELDKLELIATFHDIGKMMISNKILNKPGSLDDEEWDVIKRHPLVGYRICSSIEDFSHIAEEVLSHHERWDGGGYPRGIDGEEIPLLARIITIVDAFDVMTSGRPYKEPLSEEEAIMEIKDCAGSQFDPVLADKFVEIFDRKIKVS